MRTVTCSIKRHHFTALTDLAAAANVTRAEMAGRLVAAVLDTGTASVQRILGREAKAKRAYVMRKPRELRGPYKTKASAEPC